MAPSSERLAGVGDLGGAIETNVDIFRTKLLVISQSLQRDRARARESSQSDSDLSDSGRLGLRPIRACYLSHLDALGSFCCEMDMSRLEVAQDRRETLPDSSRTLSEADDTDLKEEQASKGISFLFSKVTTKGVSSYSSLLAD